MTVLNEHSGQNFGTFRLIWGGEKINALVGSVEVVNWGGSDPVVFHNQDEDTQTYTGSMEIVEAEVTFKSAPGSMNAHEYLSFARNKTTKDLQLVDELSGTSFTATAFYFVLPQPFVFNENTSNTITMKGTLIQPK